MHGVTPSEARYKGQTLKIYYIGVATTEECPDNLMQLEVPQSTSLFFTFLFQFSVPLLHKPQLY